MGKSIRFLAVLAVVAASAVFVSPQAQAQGNGGGQGNGNGNGGNPALVAKWKSCYPEVTAQFSFLPPEAGGPPEYECATVKVPLDYESSAGGMIDIDLVRVNATDPDNKIGSMFINPGGPGGSGIQFALFGAPFLFGPNVRAQFDIVGFDPRGITRGSPLKCFGNLRQQEATFAPIGFPTTDDEIALTLDSNAAVVDQCEQRGNRLLGHMSTGNVARDLDRLREAVGDDMLTYYGISYGSQVGNTYANMFPDKVRAVVIDGVLDPIAWTTGAAGEEDVPFSARLRSADGAQDSLEQFFLLCDAAGPQGCAFAPDSAARYDAIANKLLAEGRVDLIVDVGPGEIVTNQIHYSDFVGRTLGAMYGSGGWRQLAAEFRTIEDQFFNGSTVPVVVPTGEPPEVKGLFPHYNNFVEGGAAVLCADSDNPTSVDAWLDAAGPLSSDNYFQPAWTWVSSICQNFDGAADSGRYVGPWDTMTANPVLVMSTVYDPATPLHGAQLVDSLLPNSQLLVVEGWGHGALGISGCASFFRDVYIVDGTLPPVATCPQDFQPFG